MLRFTTLRSAQRLLRHPRQPIAPSVNVLDVCFFSTDNKKEEKKDSLKDTVHRIRGEDAEKEDASSKMLNDVLSQATHHWGQFSSALGNTWKELQSAGERKSINKKIYPEYSPDAKPYDGPVDLMVLSPEDEAHLTAWERMQKRLTQAPIIQDILEKSDEFLDKSGAKRIKQKADHLAEDAREAWETSQNPWVYRISSVYETVTEETAESKTVKELRKLDPEFTLEDWRQDVVEHTLPIIMKWFLEGKIEQLQPWLGESVFKRLAAEMTARKKEGVQIDTHVLGIMNSEIIACEPDHVEKGSPIIILHFMCQQINCVRKKKDGEIVEGSEDDIRANSYVVAFQREFNEERGELNWKIVDFRFNGAIAYI